VTSRKRILVAPVVLEPLAFEKMADGHVGVTSLACFLAGP
jgi:hypothetical protein